MTASPSPPNGPSESGGPEVRSVDAASALLLDALDEVRTGLAVLDGEGRIRALNRPGEELLRQVRPDDSPDDFIGLHCASLVPWAEAPEWTEALEAVLEGRARRLELHALSAPRSRYWDVTVGAVGQHAFLVFEEIGERMVAGPCLDILFRHYPNGAVVIFDRDLRYRYVGGDGFEGLPIRPSDLVGKTLEELWEPAVDQALRPIMEEALAGGHGSVRVVYEKREYFCWSAPLPDAGEGERLGLLMTQEVPVSTLFQQELRLVRQAVAALEVGVSIADAQAPDRPLIFLNEGFSRLTGYSVEESLGRNCRFLQGPDTDPEAVREIREAIAAGRAIQRTLLNYRKDGTAFWNRVSISPVRDGDGTLTHFIGIQEDVTEQRRLGLQLEMSDRLQSVGRLAGGIAHDIRNVLAGAKMLLQLTLEEEALPDEVRGDLVEADAVLGRGESVTSQLLAFARKHPLKREVVDLARVTRERALFLSRFLRDDIRVSAEADGPLWVDVDPGRMDQIFFNLATNSETAMPDGGELTFRVREVDAGQLPDRERAPKTEEQDRWVLLTVADSGVGMNEETRSKAFDPFFTTRGEKGGTGLGLASVFGTMEQMGGHVWIQSEMGRGTRVHLAFPPAPPPDEPAATGTTTFLLETRPLKILLAEDNPELRRALEKALSREGHQVLPAADGASALALLKAHESSLDLIVSDIVMPQMSGTELVEEALRRRPELGALLMSGYSTEEWGGLGDGVRFLSKPFDLETFLGVVHGIGQAEG